MAAASHQPRGEPWAKMVELAAPEMVSRRSREGAPSRSPSHSFSTIPASGHHGSGHGTSSAFSASANPDEDWTKITDLAERRRIQNRIAQRNYRKKQKKRLEDAEARAASAHQSPQALHQELESSSSQASDCSLSQDYLASYGTPEPGSRYISPDLLSSGYYPEELSEEDRQAIFPDPYANEVAASSSHLAHWGYPVSSQSMYRASSDPSAYAPVPSTYGHHPSAQMTLPSSTGAGLAIHGQYLPSMSATSPAMTKEEQAAIYVENDLTNPYGMNYAFMASLDMSTPQLDPESNHQTPSLADSLELSPAGSPPDSAGFFPGTPLFFSPGSPLI